MFWSQVTYDGDCKSSALALQHRTFNHLARSLECKGAVRFRKSCLELTFVCTICLFFITVHQPWRPRPQRVHVQQG